MEFASLSLGESTSRFLIGGNFDATRDCAEFWALNATDDDGAWRSLSVENAGENHHGEGELEH